MPKDNPQSPRVVRRTGGAYSLVKAFALLDVSQSYGFALVKAGKIKVVRLGPASPRVTDAEIERLLTHGIDGQIDGYGREVPVKHNPRRKGKAPTDPPHPATSKGGGRNRNDETTAPPIGLARSAGRMARKPRQTATGEKEAPPG